MVPIDAAGFKNRQRCLEGGAFDCAQRRGGDRQAGDGEAERCQNVFHFCLRFRIWGPGCSVCTERIWVKDLNNERSVAWANHNGCFHV